MKLGLLSKLGSFLKKNSKKSKIGLALGLFLSLFSFAKAKAIAWWLALIPAAAYVFPGLVKGVIYETATKMAYLIAKFASWILVLEGEVLSWVLRIDYFVRLPIVQLGWKISRDTSYLLYGVLLIPIAYRIILSLVKAGTKKNIFIILLMAIAINFSLAGGGAIIDLSQTTFKFFLYSALPDGHHNPSGFATALASIFDIQKLWGTDQSISMTGDFIVTFSRIGFIIIASGVFIIIFGLIIGTIFVANFMRWILLILAPLAWTLSVAPIDMLKKLGGEWWSTFIKWNIILPVMSFFVFLSFQISTYKIDISGPTTKDLTSNNREIINSLKQDEALSKGQSGRVISVNNEGPGNPQFWIGMFVSLLAAIGIPIGAKLGAVGAKATMGGLANLSKSAVSWGVSRGASGALTVGSTVASGANRALAPVASRLGSLGETISSKGADWSKAGAQQIKQKGVGNRLAGAFKSVAGVVTKGAGAGVESMSSEGALGAAAVGLFTGGLGGALAGKFLGNKATQAAKTKLLKKRGEEIEKETKTLSVLSKDERRKIMEDTSSPITAAAAYRLDNKDDKNSVGSFEQYENLRQQFTRAGMTGDLEDLNDKNPQYSTGFDKVAKSQAKTVKEMAGGAPTAAQQDVLDNNAKEVQGMFTQDFGNNIPKGLLEEPEYGTYVDNNDNVISSAYANVVAMATAQKPSQLPAILSKMKDSEAKKRFIIQVLRNTKGADAATKLQNLESKIQQTGGDKEFSLDLMLDANLNGYSTSELLDPSTNNVDQIEQGVTANNLDDKVSGMGSEGLISKLRNKVRETFDKKDKEIKKANQRRKARRSRNKRKNK